MENNNRIAEEIEETLKYRPPFSGQEGILGSLVWKPRIDVAHDALESRVLFPNGYNCHLMFRRATLDDRGIQVSVMSDRRLIGIMQHHDMAIIERILVMVREGKVNTDKQKKVIMEACLDQADRDALLSMVEQRCRVGYITGDLK
jgi:hypothetical protein